MADTTPSTLTTEPSRFAIRLPHWGWCLLGTVVLIGVGVGLSVGLPKYRQQAAIREIERLERFGAGSKAPGTLPQHLIDAKIAELKSVGVFPGINADVVIRLLGEPDIWGNVDDEQPQNSVFDFDTSWMTTGRYAPRDIPGKMAWLYCPSGKLTLHGPVTIVMFTDKSVTRVAYGTLGDLYDP